MVKKTIKRTPCQKRKNDTLSVRENGVSIRWATDENSIIKQIIINARAALDDEFRMKSVNSMR